MNSREEWLTKHKEWLTEQAVTIEENDTVEAMAKYLCKREIEKWGHLKDLMPTPQESFQRELSEFHTPFLPKDEIWYYSSDKKSWRCLAGTGGLALVRNGEVVDIVETVCS